jgi:hypothetical protein
MTEFRTKFIYPIHVIRILTFLSIMAGFSLFITVGIPSFIRPHPPAKVVLLTMFGLMLFGFLIYHYGRVLWTQRFNIIIQNKKVYLKDVFSRKEINLDNSFKGYSYSSYGSNRAFKDFKTLLFYFNNGRIIEFPQFLYTNFKDIREALYEAGIKFLGHEPYIWKNLISRDYRFFNKE